jgi:GT2 family glycosyltransferase
VPTESYRYELSIVIVSYNTKDLLRECLQTVHHETTGLAAEVLLVDNNSVDGSAAMVETEFPQVKLIRSTINLGFAGANNVALEAARGRYIILLNSDAFLSAGSIRLAFNHMNAHPRAHVSPRR